MGRLVKKLLFSAIVNRKIANFIAVSAKLVPFIAILCVCGSPSRNILIFLLDCEMKITHVTAVTSVFQILFVLRVMFCVLVRLRYASSFQDTFQPYHMFFYFKFVIRQIDRSGKLESSVFYFVSQKKTAIYMYM